MNTRRYPRTLQAAFGPYTDNHVLPMRDTRPPLWVRLVRRFIEQRQTKEQKQ